MGLPRWTTQLSRLVLITLASVAFGGCSAFSGLNDYITYSDNTNDIIIGMRDGLQAQKAWLKRMHNFKGEPHKFTFGEGFRAGYLDVAGGGRGCPPPVPPRQYWSWLYQTKNGQEKVSAWFSGFPYGAIAAEEEGAGNYRSIQVSYPVEIQHSPEWQAGQVNAIDGNLHLDMDVEKYEPVMDGAVPPVPESATYSEGAQTSLDSQTQSAELSSQNWWKVPRNILETGKFTNKIQQVSRSVLRLPGSSTENKPAGR